MKYDLKLHGHAELSQYEILDLFVTQYISGSRNINIELYKGDITYVLCLIYIYIYKGKMGNYTHNIIMEKVSSDHFTFLSLG